ncbi:MAG: UDP-N-acetylmuramoyl-L-alanyl-D-glutamate--2,6-diaminopimelate ligase [Acidimicrobiales bacterium]|nr:UDP-N-acetylmuramoyl-L-alanyl-D-glutamate--2,6-diaminopimelate ligase [Acidimicrobiales bacterium]
MELHEVIRALEGRAAGADPRLVGDPAVAVTVAVHDSRAVAPGCLYCCIPGARHDGHDFAGGAVEAGATALLVERELDLPVPQLVVPSVREAIGPVAALLAGDPSEHLEVVGVTGTNGKTTTTHLLAAILEAAGRSCGTIGTLTGARTTPEAPELQAQLAAMVAEGRDAVAMEVSSHALDQHRVDGTRFRVGVFTNLSQDHLDHHETMEAYFAAKARLFTPELCDVAVVNRDDTRGRLLAEVAAVPTRSYGLDDVADLVLSASGSAFTWRGQPVHLPLPGRFNVANALAAATAAAELGIGADAVAAGLAAAGVVAGRFERVEVGQPFLAVVDYAHTPEGLAELLGAARELTAGRVIVVFGAGGDRDHSKRPLMGEAAAAGADLVVLTTDNPRSEDPAAIISAVRAGIDDETDLLVEPDRAAAIAAAVGAAGPDDAVVVAGKGHETTQVVGTEATPFDDRLVLADAIAATGWSAGSEVAR